MSFDLDVIEKEDRLLLKQLTNAEIMHLPNVKLLEAYNTGTLVIWTKFDRIEANAKNFEDTFRNVIAEAKKHVELVFHRFYETVAIYFNNKRIDKRDPFLLNSEGRTQKGRESKIKIDGSEITVRPYTLPFASTLTSDEKALLGNPKSIFDEQGFYIYRNTATFKVWDRIDEHEGKIRYQINRDNPVIVALNDCLGKAELELLETLLSQLECYLPKYSIINDNNDSLNIVNSGADSEESRLEDEIIEILSLTLPEKRERMFEAIFKMECYEKIANHKNKLQERIFRNE